MGLYHQNTYYLLLNKYEKQFIHNVNGNGSKTAKIITSSRERTWKSTVAFPSHSLLSDAFLFHPSHQPTTAAFLPQQLLTAAAGDAPFFQPSVAIWRASVKQLLLLIDNIRI